MWVTKVGAAHDKVEALEAELNAMSAEQVLGLEEL